jgi:hypothetical protein
MSTNTSPIVTKEQFDAAVASINQESPDHVLVLNSSANDIKCTEELLGTKEGTVPNTVLRFVKGEECCPNCGRHFSVLDLFKAALEIHSKEFLNGIIFGKEYYNISYDRDDKEKAPTCSDFGKKGIGAASYYTGPYSCH